MKAWVELPSDPKELALSINHHFERERIRLMPTNVMFQLIWHYLAGFRHFDVIDVNTGFVRAHMLDSEGRYEYQSSDLLRLIDRVAGHMKSYDLSPTAKAPGVSLEGMRSAAVGNVLVQTLFPKEQLAGAQDLFLHFLASFGSCGVMAHVEDSPVQSIGLTADIEVIHPRELVPFPSLGQDLSKVRGIGREYYMPMSRMIQLFGKQKIKNWAKDLYWFRAQVGVDPINHDFMRQAPIDVAGTTQSMNNVDMDSEYVGFVRIREVWLDGAGGSCARKIAVSGKVVIQDLDFQDLGAEAYCPIGFARYMNNGTFHGAGLYHLMFSLVRGAEQMLKTLMTDVSDRENAGWLVVPTGAMDLNQQAYNVGKGLRVVQWEPDMGDPSNRPFFVEPKARMQEAGSVLQQALSMMDNLSPIRDLIKEKGRIDSASGLGVLQDEMARAMTSPTSGVMQAFGKMYKAAAAKGAAMLAEEPRPLPLMNMTLDLAGAVIDWDKGTLSFPDNPLPQISRMTFYPKMSGANSMTQRKMEGLELLKLGVSTPSRMLIQAIQEGWDLPMWMSDKQEAYGVIVRNILTLYNDGVSPGKLKDNPSFLDAGFMLEVLNGFMRGIKMRLASVDVQEAFIQYRQFLLQQTGSALPDSLPFNPEDVAQLAQGPMNAA